MLIQRIWSMPNKDTFSIAPIKRWIESAVAAHCTTKDGRGLWVDPFVRNSPFKLWCTSNDLNPNIKADYHLDALEFLKLFDDSSVDGVFYDPPYSPRQIKECYEGIGKKVTIKDTQSSFWGDLKKEISRIVKPGGHVFSFGWNSGGIGKTLNFHIIEILLVPHGGAHHDTICVFEKKRRSAIQLCLSHCSPAEQ